MSNLSPGVRSRVFQISDSGPALGLIYRCLAAVMLLAAGLYGNLSAKTVTCNFTTASDIPVTAASYSAAGNKLALSIGFIPKTGANLTVIKNTGSAQITGEFSNIKQGQRVALSYGGLVYQFTADYRGGTGNDLVLLWAYQYGIVSGANASGLWGYGGTEEFGPHGLLAEINRSGILSGKTLRQVVCSYHNYALCVDGTLATWSGSSAPSEKVRNGALTGKNIVSISAGNSHTMALCLDGTVVTWGSNYAGQLGNGTLIDSEIPVAVNTSGALAGKTVVAISAGTAYCLALCSDGTVVAWGDNGYGQLGVGGTSNRSVPVAVKGGVLAGRTVKAVAAGEMHSLALCADGKVVSWGSNYSGQMGTNSNVPSSLPVFVHNSGVLSGKSVVAISAGESHSLALCSDQTLVAWGMNSAGQLGDNTATDRNAPVAVVADGALKGKTIRSISAGGACSGAVCSDGNIAAWGYNGGGSLGDGSTTDSPVPVIIPKRGSLLAAKAVALDVFEVNCLAIAAMPLSADSALAGLQLDSGAMDRGFSPDRLAYQAAVPVGTTRVSVTATAREGMSKIKVNGISVKSGVTGAEIPLGEGSTTLTVNVTAEDGSQTNYTVDVARSHDISGVYHSSGDVPFTTTVFDATGSKVTLSLDHVPATSTRLTVVENTGLNFIKGRFSNLAHGQQVDLSYGGRVYKFVANYHGGTGNDLVLEWLRRDIVVWGLGSGPIPMNQAGSGVLAGKCVLSVSTGPGHSLALCSDGTLAAWGNNGDGQFGNGNTASSNVPVAVDQTGALAGKTVVAIAAGMEGSIALCSSGEIVEWGGRNNLARVPVLLETRGHLVGRRVVAIAAGYSHFLALCSDGTVGAWGVDEYKAFGGGEVIGTSPVSVSRAGFLAGKAVVSVAAGQGHSLALCEDGTLVSWGRGTSGQLGNGMTFDSSVPVAVDRTGVLAGKTVSRIACGNLHSLALCSDGTLAAWGYNGAGQLGDNTVVSKASPVTVTVSAPLVGKSLVAATAAGYSCLAWCSDGTIVSWGSNISGQLGDGTTTTRRTPVAVDRTGALQGKALVSASSGSNHSLALVSEPASSELSELVLSQGSLVPGFSPANSNYGSNMPTGATSVQITPKTRYKYAKVTVNGVSVLAGEPGPAIPFQKGGQPIIIVVTSDDGAISTYTIQPPGDLNIAFTSEKENAAVAASYNTAGIVANLSLNFVPPVGTNLMAVRNTGIDFIGGEFSNLVQGQMVRLEYGGKQYHFIANYYGGDGNDLVLEWASRRVIAWGPGGAGQLGNGIKNGAPGLVSVYMQGVLSGKTVMSVSAGDTHSLALCSDGKVYSWGTGSYGQLGAGNILQSWVPIEVRFTGVFAGKRVVAITSSNVNNLALFTDGTVAAWGSGFVGQLGNGGVTNAIEPVEVKRDGVLAGRKVVSVSVGGTHALALCSDGRIVAWGSNIWGQLGDGTNKFSSVPVLVSNTGPLAGKSVVGICAGYEHSLALCSDGTVVAWGSNRSNQLASSVPWSSLPLAVSATGGLVGKKVVALAQGGHSTAVALCSDGTVVTWGAGTGSQIPVLIDKSGAMAGRLITSVSSGMNLSLAICSDGSVVTWSGLMYNEVPVKITGGGIFVGKTPLNSAAATHSLVVVAEPESGYQSWVWEHPDLGDLAASADPDGDGIPNLVEYVLGGNPGISSTALLPVLSTTGDGFIFSFNRSASSATDTAQTFQYSTDLVNWADVEISGTANPSVTLGPEDGNGKQPVTVTIPKGDRKAMFGRLLVRRP